SSDVCSSDLEHAWHLPALHLERGADLLGAQAVLLALHKRNSLIERLRDLFGGATSESTGLACARTRCCRCCRTRRRLRGTTGATPCAAARFTEQLLERGGPDGLEDGGGERVGELGESVAERRHDTRSKRDHRQTVEFVGGCSGAAAPSCLGAYRGLELSAPTVST